MDPVLTPSFPETLEHFDTHLPKTLPKDVNKNEVKKFINSYEKNEVNFDQIQEQIDQLNVPMNKIGQKTIKELQISFFVQIVHFVRDL